ncbi:hypothetical protein [Runella limosa]|uniref:hypothetical protein n=1 Tax=Runella limosa TaxID=370978 RepID=UPI0003FE4F9C|nr:hypothetical protein [Runella limosa]
MVETYNQNIKQQLSRQLTHWQQATEKLAVLENLASASAWQGIEYSLGLKLKNNLLKSVDLLRVKGYQIERLMAQRDDSEDLEQIKVSILSFREQYLRTETTLHFFTDAINSRTSENISSLLRACDMLCLKSMNVLLNQLGMEAPPVLTYVDNGLGASILKAGLRLWDGGTISPVAVVKVTQHNLFRPTAIIHETGHQVAHILNWNDELAKTLYEGLKLDSVLVAEVCAAWASEIAADAFAFVHTGYAAVASLHDVLSGNDLFVFSYNPSTPHPISYLRVLLNIEMCKLCFDYGAWNDMENAWKASYDTKKYPFSSIKIINETLPLLRKIAKLTLLSRQQAFKSQAIVDLIDPQRASPNALLKLEMRAGDGLYFSPQWTDESLRILALTGYKIATQTHSLSAIYKQQEQWMNRIGNNFRYN